MKMRRLLALVLCFAMLFSDATGTLASTTSGEPIVITDSSELLNSEVVDTEEPETNVTSTEWTGEEAVSTEDTEVVLPEGTEESAEELVTTTEVEKPSEVEKEHTEEVITEEAENRKTAATAVMAGYSDGENWVNIGETPYTSIEDAVSAIKAYIADRPGFNRTVMIDLQADAELTGDLDLNTMDVQLSLGLNGYTLTVLNDAVIRADVHSPNENFGIVEVAGGVTLSIMPFDPCGHGMSYDEDWQIEQGQWNVEYTNWQHVNINFDAANPGNLMIGQAEYEGGSTTAHIRLNDVYINHAKNVTIEGNVGIDGIDAAPSAIPFHVAETITVNNKGDNHYENHYVEILVPAVCKNFVWYSDGTVADLAVSDTLTADNESDLTVNGRLVVKDIHVEEYLDNPWNSFGMATRYLYQADGALKSAGTITINGNLTYDESLEIPLRFRKQKWAYPSNTAEWPEHLGVFAYTEGEVIATAPNLERQLVALDNAESDAHLFAARNEQGQLIAEKAVVEVRHWNDETNNFDIQFAYASLEEAIAGMHTEFHGAAGQYTICLYDDIRLNEDVSLPDFATYVRIEANRRSVDIFENDVWTGFYEEITFVNVDFNGHTISANGSVEWSEAIVMTNSADSEAQFYIRANEECEFRVQPLYTDSEVEQVYVNAAGEPFTWPVKEYVLISDVNINIPNGFFDAGVQENDTTIRMIHAKVIVNGIRIHSGVWKMTDLTVFGRESGSSFNTDADFTITGTFTATGGSFMEVRGKLQVGDIVLRPHNEDPYANLHFQIAKVFGPENREVLSSSGRLTFTGRLTVEEGFAGTPIGVNKKHIILTYMVDENGDIMYEDEEKTRPCVNEEHIWDNMTYENGEVLATIAENSTLTASMFSLGEGNSLAIIGDGSLKIGEAAVRVHLYIPEEDRGFECNYESVEDAFAKMQDDFGGKEGYYTITLLENTTLTENMVVPDFVKHICFEMPREWVEHFDENGEPIWIYDEAGNEIGIEGHERITALTLDMNGHSITANCDIEWSELIQITNSSNVASEIYITAEANPGPDGYWPSFRTGWFDENTELVNADGSEFSFGTEYTWIDNVSIRVPNGRVEFQTTNACTYIMNGELIVSSFKGFDGKWELDDVTIAGSTDGSFIGEEAEVVITGKTTWLGGAGVEVRGTLTFGDIFVKANEQEPYSNMWVEIVEIFDRDAEGTDDYFVAKGKVTFAGAIEIAENFKASKPVQISKKQVYYYHARDEHGNLLFHDDAKTDPMIWEDQYWDLAFESGETAAYVTDDTVNEKLFGTNDNGISFEIIEQELKAYETAVCVEYYSEEEDRGFSFSYKTLEEALENLERDFEGREGSYTFIILEDTELSEDIVLPGFVKNLRLQSEWMWIEHRDEEGNVIEIYDEEGNFMGTEGHHDVYVAVLDLNGHSIRSAGRIEVIEGLHVISDATNRGKLISTSQDGGIAILQIDNGGLIEESGEPIEVSMDKPFVILNNVDVVAENAGVDLWSLWGAYTVNGDITARFMNVRGVWTVKDVKITTNLNIESGWYDEENDCGEPDGYLTADNVSIYNGYMNNSGRLVVKDTFTAKNSGIENFGTFIADELLVPSGEFHNYEQVSVKDAEIEWFYNHTDMMYFEDDPETPDENEEHTEEWGSVFICDTFKQSDRAYSYMDGSSEFIVNVDAVINNLCTGGFNPEAMNPANITRMPGANLQINEDIYPGDERNIPVCIGIFNKPNDKVAGMGIVEVFDRDPETGTIYGSWFELVFVDAYGEKAHEFGENGWYGYKRKLERDEVLFTTDIKNVRSELVGISQYVEEGKEDEAIWETSQDGNKVVAGGYTIVVYAMTDNDWQWLKGFKVWSDAIAYIDSLANPNIGYVIELTEDINLDGSLTLPKNAAEVVIRGLGEKQIEMTCTGDISLSSATVMTNIKLNASNSTVKLNGFNLIFDEGSITYIGAAVGTKESILAAFNNSAIMIGKSATGLAGLEVMWGSRIELGMNNTIDDSAAKKLQLYSSILVIHDKLTVEEVASWDDLNTVVVKDENSFMITGTVYGPDVTWDESCRAYVGDTGVAEDGSIVEKNSSLAKAKIRISAMNIANFEQNSSFAEGDVLVTAPNVSEAWFVTGSVYEDRMIDEETGESIRVRTKIGSLTHKEDGKIRCGAGDTTPKPVELRINDEAMGDFIPYDTYATLAEAFAAIDHIGDKEGFYRIVLHDDVEITTMTTPSKARAVQIWVESEQPKTITYGGDMKLNCRLIIANAILAPQTDGEIRVGNYSIALINGTKFVGESKITGITGSAGVKNTEVNLQDTEIAVFGNIKNIAVLSLQNSVLTVEGTVNVGDVISFDDEGIPEGRRLQSTLIGTAKVTRKNGVVTKVEPQITFTGDTWYEQSTVCIELREEVNGEYQPLDFTAAEMADVLAAGIPLVKAPKISSMMLLASKENKAGNYITAKDNGYVVVRKDVNAVGVMLTYEYPFVRMKWKEEIGDYEYFDEVKTVETYCETFADAVTEINNMNTARSYEIILLPQNVAMKPVSLKMPNAKALESLTIKAQTGVADLRYTGNITFTSDVVVENVNFVQVSKAGAAYVETDTPAAVSVSTGGKELTLNGKVTFNTPIKLDGKKTGTLNVNGKLTTITYYDSYGICGSITNFAEVNIRNTNENPTENHNRIVLGDYGKETPVFSATVLNMDDYTDLIFYTLNRNAKLSVTDLNVSNGLIYVEGTVAIKNLEMDGETELDAFRKMTLTNVTLNGTPTIRGYREFTISGTVTSNTGNSVLHSAQKSASNRTPYLDIKGDVILANEDCRIGVVVDDYMDVDLPKLENSPNATGMLLTAKKASADMFVPATVRIGNKLQNNIDNAKPYSEDKENGYVLMKSGNSIYVYYGKDISVKLIAGTGEELGYYSSIADAVKAIDAIKDKEASYSIEFLDGYGNTAATAVELKLPKFAREVVLVSNHKMYLKGKVTLSASTDLIVTSAAEFAGNVTGKGSFAIGRDVTVTVKGKFDANRLVLDGGSVLDARQNVVTIRTITNNGSAQNQIIFGKDAKNVTYLTLKGLMDGENTNPVLLQMMRSGAKKADYVLSSGTGKVVLDPTKKIAVMEKAALSDFEISINEEKFTAPEQAVKANKGVYHVDTYTDRNAAWLTYEKDGKSYTTYCLDFAQAVNEINTLADKNADYIVHIGRKNTSISDVNLTDAKPVSPITMPKANVANSVTIAYSGENGQQGMEFTGNISYAGNLGFVNCEIEAANISGIKTLTLDNTVFVTTGTVKADNVVIKGDTAWDAFGKTTIGGLDATDVIETCSSSYLASKPDKNGVPTFTVNGDVPAATIWKVIKANATADTAAANRYEVTYKDRSLVIAKTAGADRFIAYPFATGGDLEGIDSIVFYKDAKNVVKNGNEDDRKVLLSYGGGVTYTKSYDEAVKLIDSIGDKNGRYEIQFLTGGDVTTTGTAGSYGKLTLPKKAKWVTISGHLEENGKPDTTLKYTGTMKTSVGIIFENIILTEGTVNGTTFIPSYAVTPVTSGKNTEINFMGTVSTLKKDDTQTSDLAFTSVSGNGIIVIHGGNVEVAGGVAANIFVMNNSGTISVEKDVKVTEMVIADNAMIEAKGKFTAKTMRVLDVVTDKYLSAVIDADGTIALTDIYGHGYNDSLRIVTNRTAANESQLTINGEIAGTRVDVAMNVFDSAAGNYREMTRADAAALLVTEENAVPVKTQKIASAPKASTELYVVTYEQMDGTGNKDWVYFGENPNENSDETQSQITTYKHDGGMYLTNLPILTSVYGYSENSEYHANFMSWEQTVKEIDKIGNKKAFYEICVERSVGQNLDGTLNPIKNLTLPSKAAGVGVYGGNIYFTGTKITPKTLTEIYDAGLYAVKAVEEDGMTMYESVTYDVNIGNNMVAFGNIYTWADGYESKPGTISGSKKGYLAFYRNKETEGNETVAAAIKGMGTVEFINFNQDNEEAESDYVVTKGISGVQNLILQPRTFVGAYEGDISVKDVSADRANMYAKNITISGTVEMSNTNLSTGTELVGDGAIKLKDVVLNSMCEIYGKQDKNGKSLIRITGKVSAGAEYEGNTEGLLQVGVFYNNDSGFVPLSDNLVLLTAPKADISWFTPADAMGGIRDGYGLYKSGKVIYYGKLGA